MERHIRILGIIWIIWSVLHLFPALAVVFFGSVAFPFIPDVQEAFFVGPLMATIGGVLGLCSILGIIAGWGLLSYGSWARMLVIVLACLALINIPFGTALGIYSLWVLLPTASEQEYRRLAGV